jgi:hypothetical protein
MKGQFKCSGANDQIQIQAAINLLARTGGTVILSDGTFMLSNQTMLVSHLILKGQGMEKTILKTVNNCPNFTKPGTIRGICFVANFRFGCFQCAIDGFHRRRQSVHEYWRPFF